jgi:hypothetical protein
MNAYFKAFVAIVAVLGLFGCQSVQPELKSPCVGSPGSPCVERPVNGPMLS